jgi:hypothetical protein
MTHNAATANGSAASDGGTLASVTDRGVYLSTTPGFSPPAQGTKVPATVPTGSGSFACSLTGLSPNTPYYVRAYATNGVGTSYGEQASFTTTSPAAPGAPALTLSGLSTGGGWSRTPVTLTCSAILDPQCSLAALQYRLDTAAWQELPGSGLSRPLTISAEGQTVVEVRVSDSAGGSATASATVRIDGRKPTTKAFKASVKKGRKVKLAYQVSDPVPGSGRATVTLKIFKGAKLKKTIKVKGAVACNARRTYNWKCTLAKGSYTFKVYATDLAGNAQSKVGSARLTVK